MSPEGASTYHLGLVEVCLIRWILFCHTQFRQKKSRFQFKAWASTWKLPLALSCLSCPSGSDRLVFCPVVYFLHWLVVSISLWIVSFFHMSHIFIGQSSFPVISFVLVVVQVRFCCTTVSVFSSIFWCFHLDFSLVSTESIDFVCVLAFDNGGMSVRVFQKLIAQIGASQCSSGFHQELSNCQALHPF